MSALDQEMVKSKPCKSIIDTRNILKLFVNNEPVSRKEIMEELFFTSDGKSDTAKGKAFERVKAGIREDYDVNIEFKRNLQKYTIDPTDQDKVLGIVNSMEDFVISSHFLDSFKRNYSGSMIYSPFFNIEVKLQ